VNLYVPGLNFIFGEGRGNLCLISLTRLHKEYYGLLKNEEKFNQQAVGFERSGS